MVCDYCGDKVQKLDKDGMKLLDSKPFRNIQVSANGPIENTTTTVNVCLEDLPGRFGQEEFGAAATSMLMDREGNISTVRYRDYGKDEEGDKRIEMKEVVLEDDDVEDDVVEMCEVVSRAVEQAYEMREGGWEVA